MSGGRFTILAALLHEQSGMGDPYETYLKAKETALEAELAAVRASLAELKRVTQSGGNTESAPDPKPLKSKEAIQEASKLLGLTHTDAIVEVLSEATAPLAAGEIWAVLYKAGFKLTADNPVRATTWALRKRARARGDVVSLGYGKWALRDSMSSAKFRKKAKVNTGRGDLSRDEHIARTREGSRRAQDAGVRIGQPPKITPELFAEIEKLIRSGERIKTIAQRFNVSTATIYMRFREGGRLEALREEGRRAAAEAARPDLRVVK